MVCDLMDSALGRARLVRVSAPRYIVNVRGRTIKEVSDDIQLVAVLRSLSADELVNTRVLYIQSVRAVCPLGSRDFGCGRVVVPVLQK